MRRRERGSLPQSAASSCLWQTTKALNAVPPQQWQTAFSDQKLMTYWMCVMLLARLRLKSGISEKPPEVMMIDRMTEPVAAAEVEVGGPVGVVEVVHLP